MQGFGLVLVVVGVRFSPLVVENISCLNELYPNQLFQQILLDQQEGNLLPQQFFS